MAVDNFAEISFSMLEHLDTGPIGSFGNLIEKAVRVQTRKAQKNIDAMMAADPDYAWEQEHRELVFDELWQVKELGSAFTLLALYQAFETATKHCLDEIFIEWPGETVAQRLARKKDEKLLKGSPFDRAKKVVGELESLPGFAAVDELRYIVNAWKHHGWVDEKLRTAYPAAWNDKTMLDDLDQHYQRLKSDVVAFAAALGARLHGRWKVLHAAAKAHELAEGDGVEEDESLEGESTSGDTKVEAPSPSRNVVEG